MTKLKTKISRLISKKIFIIFAAFLLAFLISGLLLQKGKKIKSVPAKKPLTFTRQFIGDYQYKGEIKGVMTASFGNNNNEGTVEVERNGSKLGFSIPLTNSSLGSDKNYFNPETVSFTSDDKIIEAKYNLVPNGLKEEIILNKIPAENKLPIKLKTENLTLKITPDGIPVFYGSSSKCNNETIEQCNNDSYQFHFERPFMKDGAGNVSYGVKYVFQNQKENQFQTKVEDNTRQTLLGSNVKVISTNYDKDSGIIMSIEIDSAWLHDSKRVLPIIIDPTVVHDTSAEFAAGQLNRVNDTGSGSSPVLETYYQELPTDQNTVGLWHMNESADNSCSGGQDACDSSGNGNHGTFNGNAAFSTTAKLGAKATIFDGSGDYITFPSGAGVDSSGTIELWFKATTIGAKDYIWADTQDGSNELRIFLDGTNIQFLGYDNAAYQFQLSTPFNDTSSWHHLTATWQSNDARLYIDGIEKANDTSVNMSAYTHTYVALGYRTDGLDGAADYFHGQIDDVRISKIARTPEEIKSSASRRPYSVYTSDVIDFVNDITSWNSLSWTELGVNTGDGETLKDATSLVAQWNFNDTPSTATAVSGGSCGTSCNGTLTSFSNTTAYDIVAGSGWTQNNAKWPGSGPKALMFDGSNNYVDTGTNASLNITGNMTISAWIKTTRNSEVIVAKEDYVSGSDNGGYILDIDETGHPRISFRNNAVTNTAASITVNDGMWHYVAGVYNGTQQSIYIDGTLNKTESTVSSIKTVSRPLNIGRAERFGWYFNGVIDSTRIYSRALGASEILSNYQAGNVEFQTRVGSSTNPNDGTWEAWKPTTNETAIDSMDTSSEKWNVDTNQKGFSTINKIGTINTGSGTDGVCTASSGTTNINTASCASRGTADAVSFTLSAPLGGGETSYLSGNVYHTFKANGTLTVPASQGRNVEVLVVGGGGGGGMDMGGGGGGGGVIYNASYAVTSNTSMTVTIGGGGRGGPAASTYGQPASHQYTIPATSGQNSVFGSLTAIGGGFGGSSYYAYTPGATGGSGGSGGGASGYSDGGTRAGGAGTASQGYAGGNGGGQYYSGGGGGAGAVGTSSTAVPHGGAGIQYSSISPYYWGGGGGGSSYSLGTGGVGGIGGGGGASPYEGAGSLGGAGLNNGESGGYGRSNAPSATGGSGGVNTGGGGGGSTHYNAGNKGGDGGSGIVIVKYPYTLYPINAGDTSITLPVAPTGLTTGDEFLIINQQGTPGNNEAVGLYETHVISSIVSNTIYFTDYPLKNSYDVATQRITLQRVPNYTNVTVGAAPSGKNGSSSGQAGLSCMDLLRSGVHTNGTYYIDPDGAGANAPYQVYCDMTRDGGGWTLFLKSWYLQSPSIYQTTTATGTVTDALAHKGNSYKLSDADVRLIIGATQNFDILADQDGYNSAYSTGNYEYVILRNYTGYWRFDTAVAASSTTTQFQSYRRSDNALAWTGNLSCGEAGSGINCYTVLSNNPRGGSGCTINMGSSSNVGWHHFYMENTNTDTYLYICNGAQHTSSYDLNHKWWVRERLPTLTVNPWDGTKGGILAFRANGTLTVNGKISVTNSGFRGGSALGAWWDINRASQGESYAGSGTNFRNVRSGGSQAPNIGGGGGGALANGGAGGAYGTGGAAGLSNYPPYSIYGGQPGNPYGTGDLSRLYLGSGGGGGGDGYDNTIGWGRSDTVRGLGGNGGGIVFISANTVNAYAGTIESDGGIGSSGYIAGNYWIAGGSGGGGSGGSILLQANSATLYGNDRLIAKGGGSEPVFYGDYGVTYGSYTTNPVGGTGGSGLVAIYYSISLSGTTTPIPFTKQLQSAIKSESTGAMQITTGRPEADSATVGLWHLDETSSSFSADDPTSGMLSQSGLTSFTAANCVDNNTAVGAWHTDSSVPGTYLAVDLGAGNEKAYISTKIYSSSTYVGNWSVQYSDNNSTWTTVATNFIPNGAGWWQKGWQNAGSHRYWRYYLTNTPGGGAWLTEMEWYTAAITDASSNGNHGIPTGTTVTNGFSGKARNFNGTTDKIQTSNSVFTGTGNFSIESWIKFTTGGTTEYITGNYGTGNTGGVEFYMSTTNKLQIYIGGTVAGTTTLSTNTWYHVAATRISGIVNLYVNGVLDGSGTLAGSITGTTNWVIGNGPDYTSERFIGSIDEVRVSNIARTPEEIAEAYRAGRDHYITRALASTDLSGKTSLPFYVASDRQGTFMSATVGEFGYANYQPDAGTVGLWHMEEIVDNTTGWKKTFNGGTLSSDLRTFSSDTGGGGAYQGVALNKTFGPGQDFDLVTYWGHDYRGIGMVYGPTVSANDINGYSADANGTYWGALNTTGFPSGYSGTYYGQYHAPIQGLGSATTAYWYRHNRSGTTLSLQYSTTSATGPWINILPPITIDPTAKVVVGMGEASGTQTAPLQIVSLTYANQPQLKDSSGYGNNAIAHGTTLTQGKIGKARSFNGTSDYITVTDSASTSMTNAITMDFWLKANGGTEDGLVAKSSLSSTSNGDYAIQINTSGKGDCWVNNAGAIRVQGTTSINDNKWHYIACTYDQSNIKLYVDGRLEAVTAGSSAIADNNYNIIIGGYYSTTYLLNGLLDEVRISNSARTADQIRQAYESGLRTHPITIDFKAALNSGNLIANTSDLSFTIDSTAFGANSMGSNLFLGDKIIVKENYNGTEYIAQGTVNALTVSTGAVTVTAWDSGSTAPSGGFTVNATVFKWQREYFDVRGSLSTQRDAVTNLTLQVTDGSQGANVWLDDFRSNGDNLTTPGGSTITSSTGYRYFQYRFVPVSYDPAVSTSITSVTLDYIANTPPPIPSLDLPTDTAANQLLSPLLKTTATDADSDYIRYKIELCEDVGMTTNCQTFTQPTGSPQTGWTGQNTESSTAYTSGTQATYTLQTPLATATTYYWRSYAIDPGGKNVWSNTQTTPYSFTTTSAPSAPTIPYSEGATNPTAIIDTTPEFSAIHNDSDGDAANYYEIEVNTNSGFTGTVMWDTGAVSMSNLANGVRSTNVSYAGTTLTFNGATYYWRIRFTDVNGVTGAWSTTQNFTMNNKSAIPSLDLPTDTAASQSLLPVLKTTTTDADSDYLRYKIILCTDSAMTLNCQTFTQPTGSPQTGWSGQNTQTNTAYTSGTQGTYTVQTALSASTVYYWKSYAIDPGGSNTWSNTQTTPYSFTTIPAPAVASNCRIQESSNDTFLNVIWTDNATNEDKYEVQRSVDGSGWSVLQTNLPANTLSYQDSTISQSHTYQYRVAPYFIVGPTYTDWCYTSTLNIGIGNFGIKGLKMNGLKLN